MNGYISIRVSYLHFPHIEEVQFEVRAHIYHVDSWHGTAVDGPLNRRSYITICGVAIVKFRTMDSSLVTKT